MAKWHFHIYYYQMTDISYVPKSCPIEKPTIGISWTYTALIMVFWCQRKTVRLFLKVKISFSVWAMIVLGGELASEVSRRRTELASKPPKTIMANTENDIWTIRNTPNCYLFGNRNTIIRRCRSKTKLSWVIKPEKNVWSKIFFGSVEVSKNPRNRIYLSKVIA